MLIPNVISTVLFPQATEAGETSGEMTCRVTRHTAFAMFIVCVAAIPFAFLLPVFYGAAFADVPFQVMILLPGVFLIGIEMVQVQYFNSIGLPRAVPIFWIVTVLVDVTLNLALVPKFGAVGAAVVSSFSYTLMFVLVGLYFRSRTGKSFKYALVLTKMEIRALVRSARSLTIATSGESG